MRVAFGAHADEVHVTATKASTGHMLGAAGAVEAIATVLSIVHGVVPPTINLTEPDPEYDLRIAANAPIRRTVRVALSNAFGVGGHKATTVFRAVDG